ncbi:putative enoyl CoA hydratase [Allomyces arbusculus]|nr:putative enoyl CoA hydratase [Allomyces arbusculus]
MTNKTYATLRVSTPRPNIALVELHRPDALNAMNDQFFVDVQDCFSALHADPDVRAVILASAHPRLFTAGLDLKAVQSGMLPQHEDIGRCGLLFMDLIDRWQRAFTTIDECRAPVIAVVHGMCIGGGVDMICSADMRVCTQDASFSVKEVDLAMAADIGTLQRLPKIVGNQSTVREWALTGRTFSATEAKDAGLVGHVVADKKAAMDKAFEIAEIIASKSPIAINGTKVALNYSRDHSVADGLRQIAMWNASQLQSQDVIMAAASVLTKQTPRFSKL